MITRPSSQYLLLLRHPPGPKPEPAELEAIMAKFTAWVNGLKARGQFLGSSGLGDEGAVLRSPRGTPVIDGPYAEAKEIVGGTMVIQADSLAHATELAQGCPGLDYAMTVEVRPLVWRRE